MGKIADLLVDSSRAVADMCVIAIGEEPELFKEAYAIAKKDIYPQSMRAARVVELAGSEHPELVQPYLAEMIEMLPSVKVDGVKRSFFKMIVNYPLPDNEDLLGRLFDFSISLIASNESIAVRAYSMQLSYQISNIYPEIKQELLLLIESQMDAASAGLKTIGRKILKKLRKEMNYF